MSWFPPSPGPAAAPGPAPDGRRVLSVSGLNREVRAVLETGLGLVWVEGELSNLARPSSGHWYFSLKDAQAQVRCAMFRNRNQRLPFRPQDGMQVLVRARVSLYEPRGDYQLIVEQMEPAGEGALRQAFEALKRRLEAEGLFETGLKRPLPPAPGRIGVVTSATGAAVRDVLQVLARRFPLAQVRVYAVQVQGTAAAGEIVAALQRAGSDGDCDVLLLVRGGGSLEDLWPFNEEAVARAIRACPVVVVSGVGHEIDFTIADFAADARAPTPSAAAELVSPDLADWLVRLQAHEARLARVLGARLQRAGERLHWLAGRLRRQAPGERLRQRAQRLDELDLRLQRAWKRGARLQRQRLEALQVRLAHQDPRRGLARAREGTLGLRRRLERAMRGMLEADRRRLTAVLRTLQAVSPLSTLERGYAILQRADGSVLRDAGEAVAGEQVRARLARGRLRLRVEGPESASDG